ncbi:Methyltransferase-like protein 24 [Amphibalanus amphitrite]|uniref:Methyltransferase-like protein 24 n=1 Tax=Amphibalanus amphitrite TaxID=1232801 RepID=A0A6A4X749_AMPAM|nr:Methyltransferase-like protein 24 [Amphibalanus amphitrite]
MKRSGWERQWRRCVTRRVRTGRAVTAAAALLLLVLFVVRSDPAGSGALQRPDDPARSGALQRPDGTARPPGELGGEEGRDLVAAADRRLPPAVGDGAAVFALLEATLNATEPAAACRSRAALGGWCLWCALVSVDADSVLWKAGSDGSKEVCLDRLPDAGGPRRCRVISVGINNDFSFDLAAARLGCRVDAFDPTMERLDGWVAERLRFHGVGLAAAAGPATVGGRPVPLDTLDGLLRRAQLARGPVDYLKLDIEAAEWTVLEALLSAGGGALRRVRQLTVELHLYQWQPELSGQPPPALTARSARRMLRLLTALRLAGFALLDTKPYKSCTPVAGGRCIPWIYETLWVNDSAPLD